MLPIAFLRYAVWGGQMDGSQIFDLENKGN